MEEKLLEIIIARSIKIGTIQTLKTLGLLPEVVSITQAEKIYGKHLIQEWRNKAWKSSIRQETSKGEGIT